MATKKVGVSAGGLLVGLVVHPLTVIAGSAAAHAVEGSMRRTDLATGRSTPGQVLELMVGVGCTVAAGWLVARVAGGSEVRNGVALGAVEAILLVLVLAVFAADTLLIPGTALSILALAPLTALGGYIRSVQVDG